MSPLSVHSQWTEHWQVAYVTMLCEKLCFCVFPSVLQHCIHTSPYVRKFTVTADWHFSWQKSVNGSNDSLLQAVESYGFGYIHLVLTCAPRADSHGMRLEIWGPGKCAQQATSLLHSKKCHQTWYLIELHPCHRFALFLQC